MAQKPGSNQSLPPDARALLASQKVPVFLRERLCFLIQKLEDQSTIPTNASSGKTIAEQRKAFLEEKIRANTRAAQAYVSHFSAKNPPFLPVQKQTPKQKPPSALTRFQKKIRRRK